MPKAANELCRAQAWPVRPRHPSLAPAAKRPQHLAKPRKQSITGCFLALWLRNIHKSDSVFAVVYPLVVCLPLQWKGGNGHCFVLRVTRRHKMARRAGTSGRLDDKTWLLPKVSWVHRECLSCTV